MSKCSSNFLKEEKSNVNCDLKLYFHNILFFLCLLAPASLLAQLPTLTTSVSKRNILIGEPLQYTVHLQMPDNSYMLKWFSIPENLGPFVVRSQNKIDSTYANGLLGFSQSFSITSFDSGAQVIPSVQLNLTNLHNDSTFIMMTDSIPISVSYSPADSVLPFHDIKPVLSVNLKNEWWFWIAIAAGILLLLLIIYWIVRKRKKKKSAPSIASLSDYDEAMKALEDLSKAGLPEKGEWKLYFSQLTDIFKKYLSRFSGKDQMHLTGEELIAELHSQCKDRELLSHFAETIKLGDAVKFARFATTAEDCKKGLSTIRNIIEELNSNKKEEVHDL